MNYTTLHKKLIILSSVILLIIFILFSPVLIKRIAIGIWNAKESKIDIPEGNIKLGEEALKKEIARYNKLIAGKTPKSYYIVINTTANEFSLYKGTDLIRKDKCSTGSYVRLQNDEQEEWLFKTPRGEFRILGKTSSPVWKKPDWAFVEEGLPVPPKDHFSRFEYGVLGDYALGFGNGYLIHGTLYQRFLGLPVTHGCVRLNDENLEFVYKSLSIGSKVFIY